MEDRSKTKQLKLNQEIIAASQDFIGTTLLTALDKTLGQLCRLEIEPSDRNVINVAYPAAFQAGYLRPEIKLEVGPLAIWVPNAEYQITSYAAEEFPKVFETPTCTVKAIKAERTFWEKATILHQEAHRAESSPQPPRYSRHYYDMAMLAGSDVAENAITDLDLLKSVVDSKIRFYPRPWARYDLAKPGTLRLLPPKHLIDSLRRDYVQMKGMIFGRYPEFDEIFETLGDLEKKVQSV